MLKDYLGHFGEGKSPFQSQPISKEDFDFFPFILFPPPKIYLGAYVYACTHICAGARGGQEKAPYPMELELKMV